MKNATEKQIGVIVGLIAGAVLVISLQWFHNTYQVRSPMVVEIRTPVVKRVVNSKPTPTPTPTPEKENIKLKTRIIPEAEAAERKKTDAEMALYVYFGNDPVARAVAQAESGMRCKAISPTSDYGLFQIHLPLHQWRFDKFGGDPMNCWDSAKVAYELYKEQGNFTAWTAYNSGAYKKFLEL